MVFDWNGTLFADSKLRYRLNQDNVEALGRPKISFTEYQSIFRIPLADYYRDIGISEEQVALHAEKFSIEFHTKYDEATLHTRSRRGTRQLLEYCRQNEIECVILSNHHVPGIVKDLERLKLDSYFSTILANDSIHGALHTGKKQRIIDHLRDHKIQPDETVIIGDTDEEVVIGGALDLKTIAITGGTHSKKRLQAEHPDLLVDSLREIIPKMEGLGWLQ